MISVLIDFLRIIGRMLNMENSFDFLVANPDTKFIILEGIRLSV